MSVTKDQAHMLATLAQGIRAETHGAGEWDTAGIVAQIEPVLAMSLAEVMRALSRLAEDATAKTPGGLRDTKNACWRERTPERETFRPPRADEMCQTHGAGYIDACPGCRADQLAGDSTPPRRQRIEPTSEYLAARQALRNHEETP